MKNSVAQIAAFLFPALVLLSLAFDTHLTFVLGPVFIGALVVTALAMWQITGDGEALFFEGAALVGAVRDPRDADVVRVERRVALPRSWDLTKARRASRRARPTFSSCTSSSAMNAGSTPMCMRRAGARTAPASPSRARRSGSPSTARVARSVSSVPSGSAEIPGAARWGRTRAAR